MGVLGLYETAGFQCSEGKIRLIYFEICYSILKLVQIRLVTPPLIQNCFFLIIETNIRTLEFYMLMVMDPDLGLKYYFLH